jgi:hypothetical protein
VRGSAYIEADIRDDRVAIHHDGRKLASTFAHIVREMLV